MFDVSWGDPQTETVAQRKERKDREDTKSTRTARRSSLRSEDEANSVKPPSLHLSKGLGLFSRKTFSPEGQYEESPFKTTNDITSKRRLNSNLEIDILATNEDLQSDYFQPRFEDSAIDQSAGSVGSNNDSLFSNRRGLSTGTASTWSSVATDVAKKHEIQPLSPRSFVARSTEVSVSFENTTSSLDGPLREVHISVDGFRPEEPLQYAEHEASQPSKRPLKLDKYTSTSLSSRKLSTPISPTSSSMQALWKPPEVWGRAYDNCDQSLRELEQSRESDDPRPSNSSFASRVTLASDSEQSHLQRHIRRMEAATPKIVLERLKEQWAEVADPTISKELELEKQLWMLTALRFLVNTASKSDLKEKMDLPVGSESDLPKVLSLYETQASVSFLATFTTPAEIHHLSTTPASSAEFPQGMLRPLAVPTHQTRLPYGPGLFSKITSLPLPSLLPSASIPPLLRECRRILLPGGTLSLTIIDPSPTSSTMGPRLRSWLESRLLLNLETSFRCVSPSRLMPIWLQDNGFDCKSHGGTRITFPAVPEGEGMSDKGELTATVGRLLWKEVWGSRVSGGGWWWEDERVVEECSAMGTRWECWFMSCARK